MTNARRMVRNSVTLVSLQPEPFPFHLVLASKVAQWLIERQILDYAVTFNLEYRVWYIILSNVFFKHAFNMTLCRCDSDNASQLELSSSTCLTNARYLAQCRSLIPEPFVWIFEIL